MDLRHGGGGFRGADRSIPDPERGDRLEIRLLIGTVFLEERGRKCIISRFSEALAETVACASEQ